MSTHRGKLLFIVNPVAGKQKVKGMEPQFRQILEDGGFELTRVETLKDKNAQAIVEEMGENFDTIVCIGGDGTLKETLCGTRSLSKRVPVGYVPLGTTNDFANSLGVSTDPIKACKDIVNGMPVEIDMGCLSTDESFIYVAAFGNFVDMSYSTPQKLKNRLGLAAYYVNALKNALHMHGYQAKAVCDDGTAFEGKFFYGGASNSKSIAGIHALGKCGVDLSDGKHELVLIDWAKNFPAFLVTMLKTIAKKDVRGNKYIHIHPCKEVTFYFDTPTSFTLDGEYGGDHTQITARNEEHAVSVILNRK